MTKKKRGLGRDLNSLLGDLNSGAVGFAEQNGVIATQLRQDNLLQLSVEQLNRGQFQPRQDISPEGLEELTESIKSQGIIQPIIVRPITASTYEIIAGERRWRAAQLAGLSEIPAVVKNISDEDAIAMALIENIQRENLNPIEEAYALQRLLQECNKTHQEVAVAVGKSRSAVTNMLRLLNLDMDVRLLLEHGDLEMGHARALLALTGEDQRQAAQTIVTKELSVREAEKLVKKILGKGGNKLKTQKAPVNPDVVLLQNRLAEKLGAKVDIAYNKKGRGKLVIHFYSVNELEGILGHIE